MIKHASKLPLVNLVYLDSDGIWDIIPALLYKKFHEKTRIVSMNHHLVTLRYTSFFTFIFSLINLILQQITQRIISTRVDSLFILDTTSGNNISQKYKNLGFKGKIYKVLNGINLSMIHKVSNQTKHFDACFFGYLRPSKGLYQIVPIWKKVVFQKTNAKLVIIGGMMEQYKEYLLREIKKHGLKNNIVFAGYMREKKDAIKKVKQSALCVSPSLEEGWGIAVMECMASGIPAVVWDLDTYRSFLHEGVVKIKKDCIQDFSDAIVALLNNSKKRHELGAKATRSAQKYDWDIVAKKDRSYFEQIISL